jgi:hypothetical protein
MAGLRLLPGEALAAQAPGLVQWLAAQVVDQPPYELRWLTCKAEVGGPAVRVSASIDEAVADVLPCVGCEMNAVLHQMADWPRKNHVLVAIDSGESMFDIDSGESIFANKNHISGSERALLEAELVFGQLLSCSTSFPTA